MSGAGRGGAWTQQRSDEPSGAGRDNTGPVGAAVPGTGEVTATVVVNAPAHRVFAAFTRWERQGEWIPFTQVRIASGDGGEGSLIEAVTAVGPAVLRCTPMAGGCTQVVWHEWFHLPAGVAGRLAWPVVWPGSKVSFTGALRRFARLVEAGTLP